MAVLCNPLSGSVRRGLADVRRVAKRLGGDRYNEATSPAEVGEVLPRLLRGPPATLCVVGGDGTLQAVLTELERVRPRAPWPLIAVVPGGTTNMTAKDLGVGDRLELSMQAIESWHGRRPDARHVVERPVLRIEMPDTEVVCGMFFGAGAVSAGVEFFHRRLHGSGVPKQQSIALSILRVLGSLAIGGSANAVLAPQMACEIDGNPLSEQATVLCLVSTLDRLLLGTRPFWGNEDGPIHFTVVRKGARGFWWNLRRVARGRPGRALTPAHGYHSHDAAHIKLSFDGTIVVDGELFESESARGPVSLTARTGVQWLVP